MLTSKKGMSGLQIYRFMGFGSYKTAWYMCHRVRAALADRDFEKLAGIVEVYETFVGGKAKSRPKDRRGRGRGSSRFRFWQAAVARAVPRNSHILSSAILNVPTSTLHAVSDPT